MRFLLWPEEERALYRHLRDVLGLLPLGSNNELSDEFPHTYGGEEGHHYFWCRDIGPLVKLGEAPPPRDAKEAVLLTLNKQADPEGWSERIDLARTPVISWRRPSWYRKGRCLVAGRLGAIAAQPELRRLHARIDRWLRKPATKINPFRHCTGLPVPEPSNLATFWVAAWPLAKAWIDNGGELWPWDA